MTMVPNKVLEKPMLGAPDNDPFSVIREAGTDAGNYDMGTEDIIRGLQQWQKLCTFRVTSAEYDKLHIVFETLPQNMNTFVRELYDFCPDLIDQSGLAFAKNIDEAFALLKAELQRTKEITLWWD